MEQLIRSVQNLGSFTDAQLSLFLEEITVRQLKKEEHLLKEGQVCRTLYFLNKGSLRQYHITDEGNERTLNFFVEGDWVLDYQSFISQKPAQNFITAFDDSEVAGLDVHSLHKLIGHSEMFFKLGKLLETGIQPANLFTGFSSPEERYREILDTKPIWFQRFPLHLIASYLGIAPETLSRIRRRINAPAN